MFKCWCQIFKKCPSPTFFLFCFKSARLLPSLSVKMGKQESEICQLFNKILVRKKNCNYQKAGFWGGGCWAGGSMHLLLASKEKPQTCVLLHWGASTSGAGAHPSAKQISFLQRFHSHSRFHSHRDGVCQTCISRTRNQIPQQFQSVPGISS